MLELGEEELAKGGKDHLMIESRKGKRRFELINRGNESAWRARREKLGCLVFLVVRIRSYLSLFWGGTEAKSSPID